MSHIMFPPYSFCPPPIILPPPILFCPPGNCLMIYTIYPGPISFPHPWIHFAPKSFCPCTSLPPGNCLMNNTIYTIYPCSISFFRLDSFCPNGKKLFNDLHYLHVPYLFASWIHFGTLYKKKLTTGVHLVTVAPLVFLCPGLNGPPGGI